MCAQESSADYKQLIEREQRGLDLMLRGRCAEAAKEFERILSVEPEWEDGEGLFNLACCYEDIGQLDKALRAYQAAIQCNPNDPHFLGGHAAFLYLHGHPKEAFDEHVKLLRLFRQYGDEPGLERVLLALRSLGSKLGYTSGEIEARVRQAIEAS